MPGRQFVVRGQIRKADGSPKIGGVVFAFDCDLRSQQPLGKATAIDTEGRYEIRYSATQFCRAEKETADLQIRVLDTAGGTLAESPIRFNAGPEETVDITLPAEADDLSEIERYQGALAPVLGTVRLADLTQEDIEFLGGDTGIEAQRIRWLVESAKRANEDDLPRERPAQEQRPAKSFISQEVIYAWISHGLQAEPRALWARPTEELIAALRDAIERNIVPRYLRDRLEAIAEEVKRRKVGEVLRPSGAGEPPTIGDLLGTMPEPLQSDQHGAVAEVIGEVRVDDEQFRAQLSAAGLRPRHVTAVERTLRLANLTLQHRALVLALQEVTREDKDASLRSLANVRPDRWLDLAYEHGAPAASGLSVEAFAKRLEKDVEEIHPTAVIAARLSDGLLSIRQPGFAGVGTFLQANPALDIVDTNLEAFASKAHFERGVDRAQLLGSLQKIQRVKRLGANWEETGVLLNRGLDSALNIVNLGRDRMRGVLAGEVEPHRADALFNRAKAIHDTSLALMVNVLPSFSPGTSSAMPDYTKKINKALLKDYPTLQRLMGSLEFCECRDCRSVLSPAAYFVDLLEFLNPKYAAQPPLAALLRRRPDLVDLELSCENTKTELPHIDLVLEILENAVALPLSVDLAPGTDAESLLGTAPLPEAVTNPLRRTALNVGDGLRAHREPNQLPGDSINWVITDPHRRWLLDYSEESMYVWPRKAFQTYGGMPLDEIDVAKFVSELDKGRVLSSAKDRFEALLAPSGPKEQNLHLIEYQVTALEPDEHWRGKHWKIAYTLGTTVTLAHNGDKGSLTLEAPDNQVTTSVEYSSSAVAATASALRKGVVGGVLTALLPRHDTYVVKKTPRASKWTIGGIQRELELRYSPSALMVIALTHQSSARRDDLDASPENRNPEAYERLRTATFPWSLPFDLPLAEVRCFLDRAGLSRLGLMELCNPAGRLSDYAIVNEVLGLSAKDAELITTEVMPPRLWELWGLNVGPGGTATIHDVSGGEDISEEPEQLIARASVLLQQARLSFGELLDVLETRFVSGGSTISVKPVEECQPSKMRLKGLNLAHLDRLHRFVRLWKKLNWRAHELDLVISAVAPSPREVDEPLAELLRRVSHIKRLRDLLGLPIEVLASWWGGLGARTYRSHTEEGEPKIEPLFDQLFLNTTTQNPIDRDFVLRTNRTELAPSASGKKIRDKAAFIAAALGTRQLEIEQLITAPAEVHQGLREVPDELKLDNLSRIHRIVSLCKALGFSTADYLRVRRLTRLDPFVSTEVAIAFCEAAMLLRNSRFTLEELAYLLRHEIVAGLGASLSDGRASQLLTEIRAVLKAKRQTQADVPLTSLQPELEDVAVECIAALFGMDQPTASELLRYRVKHPGAPAKQALQVVVNATFIESDTQAPPDRTAFSHAYKLMQRLHKIALICSRFGLTFDQLPLLGHPQRAPQAMDVLDFNALPLEQAAPDAPTLYDEWQRLILLLQIRDLAPGSSAMLADYVAALGKADRAGARRILADGLELPKDVVKAAAEKMDIDTLDDYRDPVKLARLLDVLTALKKLGANVDQITAFTEPFPTLDAAATAGNLLRAKYGAESWRALVKPVSDALRERRRDALVEYLITREGLRDANDLYDYYLIDVQMSPCMMTTRLVQCISAVQLFVQRCLFDLERQVAPSAIDRQRWEWMKNYRVWEANRKVFLYPENWLSPELRDDKTQIFRELESALNQDEPTHEHARDTLLTYLDQLGELAQVAVIGMYADRQSVNGKEQSVLYVVGRSPNPPFRYFWRKCDNFGQNSMQWSGWECVELGITGDHALPFVFEGDFHIGWPIIQRVQTGKDTYQWEVQMAWARHTVRGWNQRKVSRDSEVFRTDVLEEKDERATFAFRVETTRTPAAGTGNGCPAGAGTEQIRISCYAAKEKEATVAAAPLIEPQSKDPSYKPEAFLAASDSLFTMSLRAYIKTGDVYNYAKGATVTVMDPIKGREYRWGVTDDNGHGLLLQISDLWEGTVTATVKYPAAGGEEKPQSIILNKGKGFTSWFPEFIFERPTTPSTAPSKKDPERDVDMPGKGYFVLSPSSDMTFVPTPTADLYLVDGALAFANGYREKARRTGDYLTLHVAEAPVPIFKSTPGRFVATQAFASEVGVNSPPGVVENWHYHDERSSYYIRLRQDAVPSSRCFLLNDGHAQASCFRLSGGVALEALFSPRLQQLTDYKSTFLSHNDSGQMPAPAPESMVEQDVSFDLRAPYAIYNWELFFHAPLLIADFLSQQQRFEDAQRWLHFVFDPTTNEPGPDSSRFWRFLPFRQSAKGPSLPQLFDWLANPNDDHPEEAGFRNQIERWKVNPFRPHAIARMRQSAYQWRTLFTYLDNLLDWGDQQFRRDTRESIGEATLLYVLAAKILGPRPRSIRPRLQPPSLTYRAFTGRWDEFANAWLAVADHPLVTAWADSEAGSPQVDPGYPSGQDSETSLLTSLGTLYFGIPHNEQLTAYWDRVEDRLFKVRHCMNLDGVTRELPLFELPIDPELLVRATAAGVDIASALAAAMAPLPCYRFAVILRKASEICAELKSLGAALLAVLEKGDGEGLSLLRSSHEVELLKLATIIRSQQIDEAKATLEGLHQSEAIALERFRQYQRLLGNPTVVLSQDGLPILEQSSALQPAANVSGEAAGLSLIPAEVEQLVWLDWAHGYTWAAGISNALAGLFHLLPDRSQMDPSGGQTKFGGSHLGSAAGALGSVAGALASNASHYANRASLFANYQRRRDEWVHQSKLALEELKQLRKQIVAAEIRQAIAEHELTHHERQRKQSERVDAFMREKYTNQELYSWMRGQISGVYFRTYQLAYDVAKRAERAYRHELGLQATDVNFVQFGYWESLKKGLLSGEKLQHDLHRMEAAYLGQNKREYEITKNVSLVQIDPLALLQLKHSCKCLVSLPEELFDLDYPGHYMRRIKSVSLTIPCVAGPYTSVNCMLTLLRSSIRHNITLNGNRYERDMENEDDRFTDHLGAIQSIATSHGQNDSGMFELNFRDERYLPFEGAGAISTWQLEMPADYKQFDYATISDVIMHLRYTAEGDESLKGPAVARLRAMIKDNGAGMARLFSLRHEFPTEWAKLTQASAGPRSAKFAISMSRFPFFVQGKTLKIKQVDLYGVPAKDNALPSSLPTLKDPNDDGVSTKKGAAIRGLVHETAEEELDVKVMEGDAQSQWELTAPGVANVGKLKDIIFVCGYTVT